MPEIAGGFVHFAPPLVRLRAPQMRQHRVGPKRDGAAVRFERDVGLIVSERGVPSGQERPVIAFSSRSMVGHGRRHRRDDDENCNQQRPLHRPYGNTAKTELSAGTGV